jgi:hypothetical protein
MTKVLVFLLCSFSLLYLGCEREQAAKSGSRQSISPEDLLSQMLGPEPDLGEVRRQLNKFRSQATKEEMPLLEEIDALLKRADGLKIDGKSSDKLQELTRAFVDIERKLAMLHPDDFEVQIKFASSLFRSSYSLENLEVSGEAYRKEALSLAMKLIEKFPDRGRSYGVLAHMKSMTGGDKLECMKLYKRCIDLDSKATYCREGLQHLAKNYTNPRCEGDALASGLAFFEARTKAASGFERKVEHDKKTFHLAHEPLVTHKDIKSIVAEEEQRLIINLESEASRQFAEFTEQLANRTDQDGYLAVMNYNNILVLARVLMKIKNGRVALSKVDMNAVCNKVTRRNLPDELQLSRSK